MDERMRVSCKPACIRDESRAERNRLRPAAGGRSARRGGHPGAAGRGVDLDRLRRPINGWLGRHSSRTDVHHALCTPAPHLLTPLRFVQQLGQDASGLAPQDWADEEGHGEVRQQRASPVHRFAARSLLLCFFTVRYAPMCAQTYQQTESTRSLTQARTQSRKHACMQAEGDPANFGSRTKIMNTRL